MTDYNIVNITGDGYRVITATESEILGPDSDVTVNLTSDIELPYTCPWKDIESIHSRLFSNSIEHTTVNGKILSVGETIISDSEMDIPSDVDTLIVTCYIDRKLSTIGCDYSKIKRVILSHTRERHLDYLDVEFPNVVEFTMVECPDSFLDLVPQSTKELAVLGRYRSPGPLTRLSRLNLKQLCIRETMRTEFPDIGDYSGPKISAETLEIAGVDDGFLDYVDKDSVKHLSVSGDVTTILPFKNLEYLSAMNVTLPTNPTIKFLNCGKCVPSSDGVNYNTDLEYLQSSASQTKFFPNAIKFSIINEVSEGCNYLTHSPNYRMVYIREGALSVVIDDKVVITKISGGKSARF